MSTWRSARHLAQHTLVQGMERLRSVHAVNVGLRYGSAQAQAMWARLCPNHVGASTPPSVALMEAENAHAFAQLITTLLQQNLEAHPHRTSLPLGQHGRAALIATDLHAEVTLLLSPERIEVHSGIVGIPDLTVQAASHEIVELSRIPLRGPLRLPQLHSPQFRKVMEMMRGGQLRCHGALSHLPLTIALTQLMSVDVTQDEMPEKDKV